MDSILAGLRQAIALVLQRDPLVIDITLRTLLVSGSATAISLAFGLPAGTLLALKRFPGRRLLLSAVNAGMGLPPVVVGLFIALMLWRSGPLGFLRIIYTPAAMIAAQVVIASPIIAGFSAAGIQQLDPRLRLQLLGLGATGWQVVLALWWEARLSLLAATIAGFGGAISEVGASMMVGGNIAGQTRVLTTATVLATSRGDFDLAMALGLLLLLLSFTITAAMTWLQQGAVRR